MLPMPQLLTSVGVFATFGYLSRSRYMKIFLGALLILAYTMSFANYLSNYATSYKYNYSQSWQYGYKQVVGFLKENYTSYDKIIVTKKYGEPHEFILFYWPWVPTSYHQDKNLNRFHQSQWYWVDGFDKYYFVNDWQIRGENPKVFELESKFRVDCTTSKCLLVTSPGNVPPGWSKLEEIRFLDDEVAFEIYEN